MNHHDPQVRWQCYLCMPNMIEEEANYSISPYNTHQQQGESICVFRIFLNQISAMFSHLFHLISEVQVLFEQQQVWCTECTVPPRIHPLPTWFIELLHNVEKLVVIVKPAIKEHNFTYPRRILYLMKEG